MSDIDHQNIISFLLSIFISIVDVLNSTYFWGLSLWYWMLGFAFTAMLISVFWKGARS